MKKFLLKVERECDETYYTNHSTYHKGDAGLDLFIINDAIIEPNKTKLIDLGVRCQCRSISFSPKDWIRGKFYKYHSYLLVPRSSISKTPLMMCNSIGIIDKGYTGTLKCPFYNTSNKQFILKRGERFVQLVNADLSKVDFKLVNNLRYTSRGDGGFVSTFRRIR